ncbi:hypothetical protein [Leifsonia sp. NPDC080035]|uniref:Uncharacterized protein n=1 Tax=Leifsonia sp. NPDC080035 TaxID=3143936 RepID=A0AAU7GCT4_9MICO
MTASGDGSVEYPDEAGYPDGEGTLDEGTGAYHGGDANSDDDGGERDAEGADGVEVEVEEPQGIDQLDEFDAPDARDE